jgi:hypothetical protein
MKPNLKDFPHHEKINKSGVNKGRRTCYAVYEDWFENFEKELREWLQQKITEIENDVWRTTDREIEIATKPLKDLLRELEGDKP